MSKKPRTLEASISLLTYIWLKWIDNYDKSNNLRLSVSQRRKSTIRYEQLQALRYKIINEINNNFELQYGINRKH